MVVIRDIIKLVDHDDLAEIQSEIAAQALKKKLNIIRRRVMQGYNITTKQQELLKQYSHLL